MNLSCWFVVSVGLWFVVCGLWSLVCGLWFVVSGLWSLVCGCGRSYLDSGYGLSFTLN